MIEKLVQSFLEDKRLHAFMNCFLDVGNLITLGGRKKELAQGVKFLSFKAYASCKSADASTYLMPYIIKKISEQKPEILEFYPEVNGLLTGAATFEIDDVIQGATKLKNEFNKLKTQLESAGKRNPPDEPFISNFEPFFNENVKKCIALEDRATKSKEIFMELIVKLGGDPKKLKAQKSIDIVSDHRKIFAEFGKSITKILADQEKAKKAAEKEKKKKAKGKKKKEEDSD